MWAQTSNIYLMIWVEPKKSIHKQCLFPTDHGGRSVMAWAAISLQVIRKPLCLMIALHECIGRKSILLESTSGIQLLAMLEQIPTEPRSTCSYNQNILHCSPPCFLIHILFMSSTFINKYINVWLSTVCSGDTGSQICVLSDAASAVILEVLCW